ncbi:hypothetical protein L873DRAFT_293949 [Choiromyces venosus 120613-1]|uniref:Uncharacterized protein n=1 Tax=Choiromyces venosus 120613-1 TaxID=1336337 RepID=A0A3N4IZR0_9PEZI|nr:hypothetical protein L873DRAFT_293949 [Choiromyces venosus 120613-1]
MEYLRIAARTRLLVLFGTPEVSGEEWEDVVLNITLATTESEESIPQRRDSVKKALKNASPSRITTTERFRTFGEQYEVLAIYGGKPVPNLGYIGTEFFPGLSARNECYTTLRRDEDHTRLPQFSKEDDPVLVEICKKVGSVAQEPCQDNQVEYLESRLNMATLYPELHKRPIPRQLALIPCSSWASELLSISSPVIQITGRPGSGKTVLSAQIAEEAGDSGAFVLSFYFSQHDKRRSTSNDMYLSFLGQLLFKERSVSLNKYVRSLYETISPHPTRTPESLWGLLRAMFAAIPCDRRLVVVIDAIDECDETKDQVLGYIGVLKDQIKTSVQFIVTSRETDKAISEKYPTGTIDLDATAGIKLAKERFVEQEAKRMGLDKRVEELRGREAAFREVELNMAILKNSPSAPVEFSYPQLYHRLINNLVIPEEHRRWCSRAISWVLFAARPLTVNEVAVAIAVDFDTDSTSIDEITKKICPETSLELLRSLGPLIKIHDNEVQFTDRSLRDFLFSCCNNPTECELLTDLLKPETAHERMGASCIRYMQLVFEEFETQLFEEKHSCVFPKLWPQHCPLLIKKFDFLQYAAMNWATHVEKAPIETEKFHDQVLAFLEDTTMMNHFARVHSTFRVPLQMNEALTIRSAIDSNVNTESPLEILSYLGVSSVLENLLETDTFTLEDLNAALDLAVHEGHEGAVLKIIQSCLKRPKPDDLPQPGHAMFPTALEKACRRGYFSMMEKLLNLAKEHELDNLELDNLIRTAAEYGHTRIVRLLIQTRCDVNPVTSGYQKTPMALAAKGGYELSIIELLNGKANVEGADVSPLQCAAGSGHLIALKVLLDAGKCMVDARDSLGRTALSLAAEEGHSETIQELLDRGADKETTSKRWLFTPLHFAAWKNRSRNDAYRSECQTISPR